MRILHICARIPYPVHDGGAVYVFNTLKGLSKAGNDVHLASFYSELHAQEPDILEEFCSINYEKGTFTPYNLLAVLKSVISRKPISIQHRMSISIMKQILEKVSGSFDVILLEGLHTANFIPLLKKRFPNSQLVLRHVNVEFQLLKQRAKSESGFLKQIFLKDQATLMKKFETNTFRNIDAITFISDKDARTLSPFISSGIPQLINPPGANLKSRIDFDQRENNTLIAFSNWKWTPNHEGLKWFLKDVWEELKVLKPNIKLFLAGNDLPKYIKNNLPVNVEYIGFVEDLHEFNKKGALQIVPLKSGSGVKLKVVEGLSFGNPIVSTSFGVEGIDVVDNIHFSRADTAEEFKIQIIKLLDNSSKRAEMGMNARKLIEENYSWDHRINDLHAFLEQITSVQKKNQ